MAAMNGTSTMRDTMRQNSGGRPSSAEDEDRDQHDDQQEPGAAADVGQAALADVLDVDGVAGLVGVNRHVLGPVVAEDAADVRHARDQDM